MDKLGKITLYNDDCMNILRECPDKAFDLAIVDPPYGIGVAQMNMGSRSTVKPDGNKRWDDSMPSDDYFIMLKRVSKNQIIWGGNYFGLPATRGFIVWDKAESMYGRSFSECEYAWTTFNVSARIFKHSPNDKTRIHPTQKPIALYKWLLAKYAKPGDTILDTHLGSGSSAISAHDGGFEFTGIELDPDYYNAAKQRIIFHQKQLKLF